MPIPSKPGPISAKPLSLLLSDVFSDAYAKQGFAARELVTRWAEIAGPEIAAHAEPLKMQWPRPVEGQPQEPATLVLRVEGPMALEIQHSVRRDPGAGQPLLRLERGGQAGAAPGAAVAPRAAARPRPPDPKAVAEVAEALSAIEDEELRAGAGAARAPPSSEIDASAATDAVATAIATMVVSS